MFRLLKLSIIFILVASSQANAVVGQCFSQSAEVARLTKSVEIKTKDVASIQALVDQHTKRYFEHKAAIEDYTATLVEVKKELEDCLAKQAKGYKISCEYLKGSQVKLMRLILVQNNLLKKVQAIVIRHGNRRANAELELKKEKLRLIIANNALKACQGENTILGK